MENVKVANNYQTLSADELKLVIGGKCSWGGAGKAAVNGGIGGAIGGAIGGGPAGAAAGAVGGAIGNTLGYVGTCWW